MENKIIYLIGKGAYSDYHIVGAEESREDAEAFISSVSSGLYEREYSDEYSIQEIEIGKYNKLKRFEVGLEIFHKEKSKGLFPYYRYNLPEDTPDGKELWTCDYCDYEGYYDVDSFYVRTDEFGSLDWTLYVEAVDTKAALKIAHERIGMIKARPDFEDILRKEKYLHWPSCTE